MGGTPWRLGLNPWRSESNPGRSLGEESLRGFPAAVCEDPRSRPEKSYSRRDKVSSGSRDLREGLSCLPWPPGCTKETSYVAPSPSASRPRPLPLSLAPPARPATTSSRRAKRRVSHTDRGSDLHFSSPGTVASAGEALRPPLALPPGPMTGKYGVLTEGAHDGPAGQHARATRMHSHALLLLLLFVSIILIPASSPPPLPPFRRTCFPQRRTRLGLRVPGKGAQRREKSPASRPRVCSPF